jgi:hypothetical protein
MRTSPRSHGSSGFKLDGALTALAARFGMGPGKYLELGKDTARAGILLYA